MIWQKWLKSVLLHRSPRKHRRSIRLEYEILEDRLTPTAGTLDSSFGIGGRVTTEFFNNVESSQKANSFAVQIDGKIVAVGSGGALIRYDQNGAIDPSFGDDDRTRFPGIANTVAVQADGKILVAGFTYNGRDHEFAVARYDATGTPDSSFDSDGILITAVRPYISSSANSFAQSMALQADGKIVVAAYFSDGFNRGISRLPVTTRMEVWTTVSTATASLLPHSKHSKLPIVIVLSTSLCRPMARFSLRGDLKDITIISRWRVITPMGASTQLSTATENSLPKSDSLSVA